MSVLLTGAGSHAIRATAYCQWKDDRKTNHWGGYGSTSAGQST